MEYPNNSVANHQYRNKKSMDEFEKNGLNDLLESLYVKTAKHGTILRRDPLIYFNVSYETAVKVRANPTLSIDDIRKDIEDSFKRHDLRIRIRSVSPDETISCLWMMYAILYLQDHNNIIMIRYLSAIKRGIIKKISLWCASPIGFNLSQYSEFFSHEVPNMIEAVKERVHSPELYPESADPLPQAHDVPEVPAAFLPPLPADCSKEGKRFYENCLQILELSVSKQKALEHQLEAVNKEKERNAAVEKSNFSTLAFNNLLEEKYNKLKKKYDDGIAEHNKVKATMQKLSDAVVEENRQLRVQLNLKIARELRTAHEKPSQSPGDTIKAIFHDLVSYACDPEYVSDAHVDTVKDVLEQVAGSPSCEALPPSERLELLTDILSIKKKRKELLKNRAKEQAKEQAKMQQMANDKENTKTGDTINNFYAPVGQQISSANDVSMPIPDELKHI